MNAKRITLRSLVRRGVCFGGFRRKTWVPRALLVGLHRSDIMCGICGEVDFSRDVIREEKYHSKMMDVLTHRGPDDSGSIKQKNVWLGHRRLSIIDLSPSGRQPMSNEDGSIWVSFNGEIYNFQEWVPWLKGRGHIFSSNTDTEVIVHLYEEKGDDFLECLNGMFAFGLWDAKRERLLLARDRLGVKPLVYHHSGQKIIFASEIKSHLQQPLDSREIDREALELYFTFNFIPAPWTIYRDIRKLPQANFIIFDRAGLNIKTYWTLTGNNDNGASEEEACYKLRELVSDAVRTRLFSDVPLGVFLSGGIDSSIVTAAAARNSGKPVKTYCIGYPGDSLFDETPYAEAVSKMYGTEHQVLNVEPQDAFKVIPDVLSFFDEPLADSSAIPTFLISKLTRQNVTVALSGDGGDEIFGGYRRYLAEVYIDFYLKLPRIIRERIISPFFEFLPDSKGNRWLEYLRRTKIFLRGANSDQTARHYSWLIYFPDKDREELLLPEIRKDLKQLGRSCIKEILEESKLDRINKMLLSDVKILLPYDMLTKVDWMSMKNSLEIRSPLLDYRIADFAFSIPGELKVNRFNLKFILRKAFKEWLPGELYSRKKQGFEIPVGEWLKKSKDFQKLFWDVVDEMAVKKQRFFEHAKVRNLFAEHTRNIRDNTHKLWAIFVFQWWYQNEYGPRLTS